MSEKKELEERREDVKKTKEAIIEEKKRKLKNELGEDFDDQKFDDLTKEHDAYFVALLKAEDVKKNDAKEDNNQYSSGGHRYGGLTHNADGTYSVFDENGNEINAKDMAELTDKICDNFKQKSDRAGKECKAAVHSGNLNDVELFAKSALKHGITIMASSDIPRDKAFWDKLKADYLNDASHNIEDWNRMTRFIPDDVMGRTAEQSAENKNLIRRIDEEERKPNVYNVGAQKSQENNIASKEAARPMVGKNENNNKNNDAAYARCMQKKRRSH